MLVLPLGVLADIADLDGGSVAEITFPNPNNLTSFKVKVNHLQYRRWVLNARLTIRNALG